MVCVKVVSSVTALIEKFKALRRLSRYIILFIKYPRSNSLRMAAILSDENFKCIFLNKIDKIPIRISMKFVPMIPIDNKPEMVQVMAWRLFGVKPLLELMLTQLTDAYMRY